MEMPNQINDDNEMKVTAVEVDGDRRKTVQFVRLQSKSCYC